MLGDVSRHMKAHGVDDKAFIYVADAAMVTQENLERAGSFITRLPATYNECERATLSAIDAEQWEEVGRIALMIRPITNLSSVWSSAHVMRADGPRKMLRAHPSPWTMDCKRRSLKRNTRLLGPARWQGVSSC